MLTIYLPGPAIYVERKAELAAVVVMKD